ncbi:hypothetical protein ACI3LY_005188 [Candidozyma auris]|uniref:Uncharacterized protein n=2 Tax=Candidozyma auris TaxID=498019 RepID=A0AB36VZD2_CANAR|nr:hypothetical protein QG37_06653 [[Candida] auris]PIS49844.1 hypothetical protein B9J08_004871 [[Candida] auris]PIS49894.1 hypothetical protein CJI97_004581 [[Candida] auris]QWW25333.1 hypothetical protein CA7LBN_004215 [[Candida] auris]
MSTADALIAVADTIISRAEGLSTVAINKKGRKFKYVNDAFQRVQEEDKHLVIYPQDLSESLATISAFSILESIDTRLFADFQDVCLTVVGVAGEIERRGWYEEEHSSVIPYKQSKFNYDMDMRKKALEFAKGVTDQHLQWGYILLYCAKLSFFHTDHHIGNKLDDPYMRDYVEQFYGAKALSSPEVIVALKSFVHWANIKGILWKLRVPNLDMSESLIDKFSSFPDPPAELLDVVWSRYPSGTSKYSLVRKSLDILADSPYSKLIPFPEGPNYDLHWIFDLCHRIEADPIRYHLRASSKRLCTNPVNLNDLSKKYKTEVQKLLSVVSLVINIFQVEEGEALLQNSKIPQFTDELIDEYESYHNKLVAASTKIDEYIAKGWDDDDIVLRLYNSNTRNIHDEVNSMRDAFAEDYE